MAPAGEQEEFMQLRAPGARVGPFILPDEETEEQGEKEADNDGGNAATEAGPIPLEHGSGPGLINNPVLVGPTVPSVLP